MSGINPVAGLIELIGGPSSVNLHVDSGPNGTRGSYILANVGNPDYVFSPDNPSATDEPNEDGFYGVQYPNDLYPTYPQILDWYINLSAQDEDYKVIYQLDENKVWQRIFKLIPTKYDINARVTFTMGTTSTDVEVSSITMPLPQEFGQDQFLENIDIPETATTVDNEIEMLALSASVRDYAWRTDRSQFYKLVAEPASNINNWRPDLRVNLEVDIEPDWITDPDNYNPSTQPLYPVASAFIVGKPFSELDEDDVRQYTFPITINAAELNVEEEGWVPLTGKRIAHITVNVI
jgi:hypothetical protein